MRLLPKQDAFFDYLSTQVSLIERAADKLNQAIANGNAANFATLAADMIALENSGDQVQQALLQELNSSFFTPIDPEDLLALTNALDDILDGIENVAHCLIAYEINSVPTAIHGLVRAIHGMTGEMAEAFTCLKKRQSVNSVLTRAWAHKKQTDTDLRNAVAELYRSKMEPVTVMKLREIYGDIEAVITACARVAVTLQHVQVKIA